MDKENIKSNNSSTYISALMPPSHHFTLLFVSRSDTKNIPAPVELYHLTLSFFVIKKAESINATFIVAFRAIGTLEFYQMFPEVLRRVLKSTFHDVFYGYYWVAAFDHVY